MLQPDRILSQAKAITLFCIPLAGAGPSIFLRWQKNVPSWLQIVPAQLRGRERRLYEQAFTEIRQTAVDLLPQIDALGDTRLALLGYSMGALVAYELARMLTTRSHPPVHLVVSASRAPHEAPSVPLLHDMTSPDLRWRLGQLGGATEVLSEEIFQLVEPTLRADLQAAETYRHSPCGELQCPITALCGERDPLAPPEAVRSWQRYTSGHFSMRTFRGGHYFAEECEGQVLGEVVDQLHAECRGP